MKDERKTKAQLIGELTELRKITGRHQTSAEQLSSELATNMREAAYVLRAHDGVIAYTNPAFARMFGYGEDEMVGRHASMVNAPTDKSPEETAAEILGDLERDGVWSGEVDNIKKDGTRFRCSAKVSSFDHAEHGTLLLAVHADITERVNAESALRERVKELRCLHDASEAIRVAKGPDELLASVVRLIPPGWQYPEITCARITVDEDRKSVV